MFTGIVQGIGEIKEIRKKTGFFHLALDAGKLAKKIVLGESWSLNGCCLTVVRCRRSILEFDLLEETARRTNLGDLKKNDSVNLERALKAEDRFGGHFVSGHIDNTGKILRHEKSGSDFILTVELSSQYQKWLIEKGSIAIDGISLTVAAVQKKSFSVWIIPHTHEITALKTKKVGQSVNLEFDLIAKYIEKILATKRGLR